MTARKANLEICRICRKSSAAQAYKPFCSKRCADIDLGRWLKGGYAIPGKDGEAGTVSEPDNPDADI